MSPMAAKPSAKPSPSSPPPRRFVSLDPDKMVEGGGGLPTGFIGEVVALSFIPHNYLNKAGVSMSQGKYSLAVMADILPDDNQGDNPTLTPANLTPDGYVRTYLGAGSLTLFVPSDDGVEPKGADWAGYESLAKGEPNSSVEPDEVPQFSALYVAPTPAVLETAKKKSGEDEYGNPKVYPEMSKSTNLSHWLQCAKDAGAKELVESAQSLADLVGLYGRWDRVPQHTRDNLDAANKAASGGGDTGAQTRAKEILVLTEAMVKKGGTGASKAAAAKPKAAPAKSAPTTPAAAGEAAAAAEGGDGGDFEARLVAAIVAKAAASKTPSAGTIERSKLPGSLLSTFKETGETNQLLAHTGKTPAAFAWLAEQTDHFIYDADADTVTAV